VAEEDEKYLYMMSAGDLGLDPRHVEGKAAKASLDIIVHSLERHILLLDEADVFLEERPPRARTQQARQYLLAHLLEYYEGIMFLTTNRVPDTFDAAFQARSTSVSRYVYRCVAARLPELKSRRRNPHALRSA